MPTSRSAAPQTVPNADGVTIERRFTEPGKHPFDAVEWEIRDAVIGDAASSRAASSSPRAGRRTPRTSSARSTSAAAWARTSASRSVKQMVCARGRHHRRVGARRVATSPPTRTATPSRPSSPTSFSTRWRRSTRRSGSTSASRSTRSARPASSSSVQDTMESILDWNTKEGKIFRGGSGSGINLSNIRASMEHLSKGGTASGPVSFMRGADSWAGTIKSGGKTRRAAKMVVLDIDHPDVLDFVWCKAKEEEKANALRDAGFDMSIDGEGFTSIQYQNANNSVRVSRRVHGARRARRGLGVHRPRRRLDRRHREGRRRAAPDRRRRVALRRSGRSVRHDHQRLAHLPELGPDQRVEPVLGVHARGRLGVQPRLDQPDEVPPRGRHLRHRRLRAHRRRPDPRAGDRRLARRATRPRRSATTRARSASSAWATPTSARC